MKVFLTSAYEDPEPIGALKRYAAVDGVREHHVVASAEDADVILFVENSHYSDDFFFRRLLAHPVLKRFPSKTLMYNEQDRPFHVIPGLYVSMPRSRFDGRRQRACAFIQDLNDYFDDFTGADTSYEPDLLYSFLGRGHRGVRASILSVRHPRGLVEDTSHFDPFSSKAGETAADTYQRRNWYVEVMSRSRFALCPRGAGTSTYRVYEAMRIPWAGTGHTGRRLGSTLGSRLAYIRGVHPSASNASGGQPILSNGAARKAGPSAGQLREPLGSSGSRQTSGSISLPASADRYWMSQRATARSSNRESVAITSTCGSASQPTPRSESQR